MTRIPKFQSLNFQIPNFQSPNFQRPNFLIPNFQIPNLQFQSFKFHIFNLEISNSKFWNFKFSHSEFSNSEFSRSELVQISNLIKLSLHSNLIQWFVAAPVRCIHTIVHQYHQKAFTIFFYWRTNKPTYRSSFPELKNWVASE